MPDVNKFSKLDLIGFTIPVTCSICVHGNFTGRNRDGASGWGTCSKNTYEHVKHDNPEGGRGVSIVAQGTCNDPELDEAKVAKFGAHSRFVER